MYHTIEFAVDLPVALETSPKQPLERLLIRRGTRTKAQVKPYVLEGEEGPIEVADLFFADGTATRGIPFEFFSFAD
jgi:hypothetical protein